MHRIIEWFARNGVAANLLMLVIVVAGFHSVRERIRFQVFPDIEINRVEVRVPYRGSTPAEVEEAIVMRIEEVVQDLEGIDRIVSTASESSGRVTLEVQQDYDPRELLEQVKNRVDSITTFPEEAERPSIEVPGRTDRVINVVIAGDMSETDLKRLGEQVRDEIANLPEVTQVSLKATRPYEIGIEVSERALMQYGLTIDRISRSIQTSSLDLSAGQIKTAGGEVRLRTKGQAYVKEDFEKIVLLVREDGTRITLGDVARVDDGFEETPVMARFNGKRAVMVDVFRVGEQNAIELAEKVKEFVAEAQGRMPPGVELGFWQDRASYVKGRLKTLTDSAIFGGALVFIILALFLRLSLAIWVMLGIPISFFGALAVMPSLDVSINIMTLFAFILVLGIVVDDAIVTGENVFKYMQKGDDALTASICGTQEVAVPVTFGVLTTVVAFIPLLMVEGYRGQYWMQIPLIVIPVLLFSLVETKLILPAHLKHCTRVGHTDRSKLNPFSRGQRWFADGLERFIQVCYRPVLEKVLRNRYVVLSVFAGSFMVLMGFFKGGHIKYVPFPRVPDDKVEVRLTMPIGTPIETTAGHIDFIEAQAFGLQEEINSKFDQPVILNVLSTSGGRAFGGGWGSSRLGVAELGEVVLELESAEVRDDAIDAEKVAAMLRQRVGVIHGVKNLSYRSSRMRGGSEIDIQLTGPSFETLSKASEVIKERLAEYEGVFDIADSFEEGKDEFELRLKPEAEHLGISVTALARQVRQAFFGAEAQRIQRGRDDVRVMVRYPEKMRRSLGSLDTMRIRTPDGVEVPFGSVAEIVPGKSLPSIRRVDRNRTLTVEADVNHDVADIAAIRGDLTANFLPGVVADFPPMKFSMEGEAKEERNSMASLYNGGTFVLFAIYIMLAIPFKSYSQPLIVMSVIPFGLLGAALGHWIMGLDFSMMSFFGCLALIGVVVNDSLVMVDYTNRRRKEGITLLGAVRAAGASRFRPIILTSLTTFCGLLPLMFEESRQAQWLIPMAVSLAYGVIFATVITLFMVPINYLILEDIKVLFSRLFGMDYHTQVIWDDPVTVVDSSGSGDRADEKEKPVGAEAGSGDGSEPPLIPSA
jgi:multidrug efflux pump subunit AcrB